MEWQTVNPARSDSNAVTATNCALRWPGRTLRHASLLGLVLALLCAVLGSACVVGAAEEESCTFATRPQQVGDVSTQHLVIDLELQTAESVRIKSTQEQDREVTVCELVGSAPTANGVAKKTPYGKAEPGTAPRCVEVHFTKASRLTQNFFGEKRRGRPSQLIEPVTGQTYRVHRVGQELKITDLQGESVGDLESEYIARTLANVGRPNPLAEYLAGKTLHVGEVVKLPAEVALELLGMTQAAGAKAECELTLAEIVRAQPGSEVAGSVAQFATSIKIEHADGTRMDLAGTMRLEVASSRMLLMDVQGDVEVVNENAKAEETANEATGDQVTRGRMSFRGTTTFQSANASLVARQPQDGTRR